MSWSVSMSNDTVADVNPVVSADIVKETIAAGDAAPADRIADN